MARNRTIVGLAVAGVALAVPATAALAAQQPGPPAPIISTRPAPAEPPPARAIVTDPDAAARPMPAQPPPAQVIVVDPADAGTWSAPPQPQQPALPPIVLDRSDFVGAPPPLPIPGKMPG
jgi:hypothetical protein